MYKCTSCTYTSETNGKFCPECGSQMAQYVADCAPCAVKAPLGKKITALALSIAGMLFGIICLVVVFCATIFAGVAQEGLFVLILALLYAILSGVPSIIALALSASCRKIGDNTILTRLSKIFGLVGLISTAVYVLIGILAALAM